MPVLKTPCPECEANMRFTVDGPGEHDVTCLKCGHEFTATLDADEDEPPAKKHKAKADADEKSGKLKGKAKKALRDDDEDDEAADTPRKKKKKGAAEDGGQKKLILAGAVGGVVLVCAIVGAVLAFGGKKDTAQKPDEPKPEAKPDPKPDPGNNPGPKPGPGPDPNPPKKDDPGTNPPKKDNPNPPKKDPPKQPEDVELATQLPPPPRIKVSGSLVPATKPVAKAPTIPPLAKDEDPFERAKEFKPDGPLPPLPVVPKTGRPLLTLDSGGHTGVVGDVFFSPKGDRIITVGADKALRFWDPATNDTVKTVRFPAGPGHEGALSAAAVSPSGKRLAIAGEPLANVQPGQVPIYIVSPETGALIKRLDVGAAAVTALHFSNDGNWLGVGCKNGTVQMVNVNAGTASAAPRLTTRKILEVRYNPNPKAKLLATLDIGDNNVGYVGIWNFGVSPPQYKDIPVKGPLPAALGWSNDGFTLAVGCTNGETILATHEGKMIKTLPALAHGGRAVRIGRLRFLPGDREIAMCGAGNGGWAGIVNADTGKVRVANAAHTNAVSALDVSSDGNRIVSSGGNQHETLVWDVADGKLLHRLQGTGSSVWAIAWAKDGKSIAFGNSNVREAPNAPLPLEGTFRLDELGVGDAPDPSKYTATVDGDDHVKLMTGTNGFMVQTTGRPEAIMQLPGGEKIHSGTVLPKANAVLFGGVENLYMVTPSTLEVNKKFIGHSGNVLSVTPSPDSRYFATGSSDQTIRIWARDRDEPVLSIFIAGREWIAWNPQGFYACSPQGEGLIAWQINAGNVKFPQVHPAARFRPSMYQPALIKYLVPAGDTALAMAMAKKYDKALFETNNVADVLPPEVTLDGFTDGAEVKLDKDKDKLTVKARATSAKHPVVAMRLLVDGRPFNGADGVKRFAAPAAGGMPTEVTWEVPLLPGTHTVAVIADTPVSKGMSKMGVVTRAGDPPKPNLYILTVGVSEYPKGVNPLNYCATDAILLEKTFKEKSKSVFATIETKVLTDKAATKQGIRDGLDWLKSKMTPKDVGIVSFSGHGTRDPFGRFYLCPADIDPAADDPSASCLSGDEFKSRLDNMPGRLVAILDACHSGTVADKERPPARADNLVRDLTAEDSGVIVMCASLGREYAIESKLTKAGFFTLGLVEGLSGHGDVDGDGTVYIHELDMYATARVRQLSMGKQNPTLGRPPAIKPFPIAKVEKPLP